jgi:hypothetical protein
MTQDLNKQFNIPAWVKGNTIADESASVMKRFEGRNDNASIATKEALLKSIMKKQEFLKMQEAIKTQSQQIPDQMDGQVPEGMSEFMEPQEGQMAYGGEAQQMWNADGAIDTGIGPNSSATPEVGAGIGNIGGAAQSLLTAGQDIFGKPNVNVKGDQHYDINQFKKDKLSKGIGGAVNLGKGIVTGDPMAIVKGGADLLGSVFGGGKKEMEIANQRFVGSQNAELRQSDFAYGGIMSGNIRKKPGHVVRELGTGGFRDGKGNYNYSDLSKPLVPTDEKLFNPSVWGQTPTTLNNYAEQTQPDTSNLNFGSGPTIPDFKNKTLAGRALDWTYENAANIGQFAPIASNLLELKNLKKSPTQRGTRLDSVYKEYNPDEARELNILNQQNTERALTEGATGNAGNLQTNLQAAGLNKLKGQSAIMSGIDQIKAGESAKGQQFKQQGDTVNAELDRDFLDRSARDKAAFETTKSNLKSALFEDVGKISKEHLDKKMVQKMFGYKWTGEYYTDKDGKQISTSDVWKQVQDLIGGDKTKKGK